MEYSTWEQIANIPWPFYAFACFIFYTIYRTTKPSIVPVRLYLYIPTFLILASFLYVTALKHHLLNLMLFWLPGAVMGVIIGILTFKMQPVKAIVGKKKLYLPGSWSTIILLTVITGSQGLLSWLIANNPAWQQKHVFDFSWFFIYGFFAGLFIGRMRYAFRCMKHGPFITMEEVKVL